MKRIFMAAVIAMFLASACFGQQGALKAESCERLARVALPEAKITLAQQVAAGGFTPSTPVTGPVALQLVSLTPPS